MHRTLFLIPHEVWGIPVFGLPSWTLGIWAVAAVIVATFVLRREGWNEETRGVLLTLGIFGLAIAFVLPWIEIREPEGLRGLAIRGYGVFMLIGIVSGVSLATYRGQRMGIVPDAVYSMAIWACACGLAGARLFYIVTHWHQFQRPSMIATLLECLKVSDGGLVVYGSFFGGILGLLIYATRVKRNALELMDLAAPCLMLGVAFGRLGCLMNGCCFGGICDAELPSIQFPFDSPAYQQQWVEGAFWGMRLQQVDERIVVQRVVPGSIAEGQNIAAGAVVQSIQGKAPKSLEEARRLLGNRDEVALEIADQGPVQLKFTSLPRESVSVHPVQIYSSIDGFLLCLVGIAFTPFRRRPGEVAALTLALYSITRFIEEMVRDDTGGVLGTSLSIGQVVSILLLTAVVLFWIAGRRFGTDRKLVY